MGPEAILAPRRRGGALRQRCEEQEVPLETWTAATGEMGGLRFQGSRYGPGGSVLGHQQPHTSFITPIPIPLFYCIPAYIYLTIYLPPSPLTWSRELPSPTQHHLPHTGLLHNVRAALRTSWVSSAPTTCSATSTAGNGHPGQSSPLRRLSRASR